MPQLVATIPKKNYSFSVMNLKQSFNSYLPLFLQVYLLCQRISAVFSTVFNVPPYFWEICIQSCLRPKSYWRVTCQQAYIWLHQAKVKEKSTKSKTFSCCRGHRTASEDVLEGTGGNFIGSLRRNKCFLLYYTSEYTTNKFLLDGCPYCLLPQHMT